MSDKVKSEGIKKTVCDVSNFHKNLCDKQCKQDCLYPTPYYDSIADCQKSCKSLDLCKIDSKSKK